ncbi:MAG: hypothetical protein L0G25_06420, partial [Psychrobacter sp.]|nr:hypothetical protein [Psychrobacter sp.]
MTDNTLDDKSKQQLTTKTLDQAKANEPKTDNANKAGNKANSNATSKTAPKPEAAIKKVDIAIAGVNYSVFCPANE